MLLGMLPYTFITTGAGSLLNELQSVEQLLNWQTFSRLSLVAGVAFALPLLKRRLRVVNSISSDKSQ
jgi:uncharacterized membrane protein YdjX (TVP38/TMEM64 family)